MWFPPRYLRFIAAFLFLSHQARSGAAGESASFRPALVGNGPKSLVNLIDTAKLMQQGQQDAVVMFDAWVVDDNGGFVSSFECHGSPGSDRLKKEVSRELLRAVFVPALVRRRPVGVLFRGSVIFAVRDGHSRLQVLANQDQEELARGSDYIEPQMILGTDDWVEAKPYVEVLRTHLRHGIAVVSITVDAEGKRKQMHLVREDPVGLNVGAAALKTLSTAKFIPAFRNGRAVAATFEMSSHMYGYRASR